MKKKLSEQEWIFNQSNEKNGFSYANYDSDQSPMELFYLPDGGAREIKVRETYFLYNRQGEVCLFSSRQEEVLMTDNQLVLLTPGEQVYLKAEKESSLLLWKINEVMIFCEYLKTNSPQSEIKNGIVLTSNQHIANMFGQITALLEEGFYCNEYMEGKLCEMLILMKAFFPKEVLVSFFQPVQSINPEFKKQVLLQYSNARNVEELAAMVNLSRSGFHQYFKKVVGKSPSRWMNEEKARKILIELTTTSKTLKEIWMEYNFSSASYFNQFCWQHLGNAPSKLRNS